MRAILAVVALLATFVAQAATVTIKNGPVTSSCAYSSVTGTADALVYTCGTPPVNPVTCAGSAPVVPGPYSPSDVSVAPNQTVSYLVPDSPGGYIQVFQAVNTPPATQISMYFSNCPGIPDSLKDQVSPPNQFGPTNRTPCKVSYNYTGGPIYWNRSAGSTQNCKTPNPVYLNISVGASCVIHGQSTPTPCPLKIQWNPQ